MSGTLRPPPFECASSDGPRHHSSLEMTAVRPRDSLPPVSSVPGPTIEQLDEIRRAQQEATETLVGCPACADCPCCRGAHMVSADRAVEWRRNNP